MITLNITPEQLIEAKSLESSIPKEIKNSILDGEGRFAGFVGELVVRDYYTGLVHQNNYEYDLVVPETGVTIDVKTKQRNVPAQPHYLCSVTNHNPTQKCDYYFFVSLHLMNKIPTKAHIMGYIRKTDFYENCFFGKKGEPDPTDAFGFKFRTDCWNIKGTDLLEWEMKPELVAA